MVDELIALTSEIERTAADQMRRIAAVADQVTAAHVFTDYAGRKSDNTIAAQRADLQTFSEYLAAVGIDRSAEELQTSPAAWEGMSYGLVTAFQRWMIQMGYAVSSANRKLSTVKTYCKLAAQAGTIPADDLRMIQTVTGYAAKEGRRVDGKRSSARRGSKKAAPTTITRAQAVRLKSGLIDSDQGIRDDLLMCLLLDHGLRVSEIAALDVSGINLSEGEFSFYRPKVDRTQRHRMSGDTRATMREYFAKGLAPERGPLLRSSRKDGSLSGSGMNRQSISARVRLLGERAGIENLSAHDCRHFWATDAVRRGVDPFQLQQAGGWTSMQTVRRYVEDAEIANEGMV